MKEKKNLWLRNYLFPRLRDFNWWKKGIAFLGQIGAVVAIFLLWGNLRILQRQQEEMQRQTELENRGFLAIAIDSVIYVPKSKELNVHFSYYQSSRVPIIIRYPQYSIITEERELDVSQWCTERYEEWVSEWGDSEFLEVLVYEEPRLSTFRGGSALNKLDSLLTKIPRHQSIGKTQSVFLHILFRYKDILEHNYWVYTRWEVNFEILKRGQEGIRFYVFRSPEDYVIWQADSTELIPDNLPERLKALSPKARAVQSS